MLLVRVVARVVGMLLTLALALLGWGIAVYCFDGFISLGSARPDRLLGLPSVRRHVGRFLAQIAAPGDTAALALLGGLGAMLLGLLLLIGTLRSRRPHLVVLDRDTRRGTLAARPRVLGEMSQALAEQARAVTRVKRPKPRLSRRGAGGRLAVTASRARTSDRRDVERAVKEQLEPISGPFGLKPRVRLRLGRAGERVQ